MPFYKKQNTQLVSSDFVDSPSYSLSVAGKDDYMYPVDGWYWFDSLDAAISGFASLSPSSGLVSPRQIRQALTRANLRDQIELAVKSGSQDLKDWWEYSTSFDRSNPQVEIMRVALGVTELQLEALWKLAETL